MYLNFEEYKILNGKIEEQAAFENLEAYASSRVDYLTRNRIKEVTPMPISENSAIVSLLKQCIYSLIEFYNANDVLGQNGNIISKSNNGISVSYAQPQNLEIINKEYFIVKTYLQNVTASDGNSVMWRGVK